MAPWSQSRSIFDYKLLISPMNNFLRLLFCLLVWGLLACWKGLCLTFCGLRFPLCSNHFDVLFMARLAAALYLSLRKVLISSN